MSEGRSNRLKQAFRLGGTGVKWLVRDPVKEAVREALAEEGIAVEERRADAKRQSGAERTGSGNRILRPAVLLPVLGLAAAGVLVSRRKLMKIANEKGVVDRSGRTTQSPASSRRTGVDSDLPDVGGSSSNGNFGEDAEEVDGSTTLDDRGEDAEEVGGSTSHGDYGDGDDVGESTGRGNYGDDADDSE